MDDFEADYTLRPCEGPGCREVFEPSHPRQRFHRKSCRKRAYWARQIDAIVDDATELIRAVLREHLIPDQEES